MFRFTGGYWSRHVGKKDKKKQISTSSYVPSSIFWLWRRHAVWIDSLVQLYDGAAWFCVNKKMQQIGETALRGNAESLCEKGHWVVDTTASIVFNRITMVGISKKEGESSLSPSWTSTIVCHSNQVVDGSAFSAVDNYRSHTGKNNTGTDVSVVWVFWCIYHINSSEGTNQ